ncbi:MAG TPA: TetR/AcrR family transcriptional regulator [Symbiobacteriaceae bacterium]|jgi:AcrR family transcriptional regulator
METVAFLVAEGRINAFSMQDVADRAGISYASVYRHFPNREALLEAMYEWGTAVARSQTPPAPRTLDEIPAWVEGSIPVFEQHAAVNQAIMAFLAAVNSNPESRRSRDEAIDRIVADSTPHLSEAFARRAAAVIRYLAGSQGWASLRQRFGLDPADTAAALTWALQVLIREIKQAEAAAGPNRQEEGAES